MSPSVTEFIEQSARLKAQRNQFLDCVHTAYKEWATYWRSHPQTADMLGIKRYDADFSMYFWNETNSEGYIEASTKNERLGQVPIWFVDATAEQRRTALAVLSKKTLPIKQRIQALNDQIDEYKKKIAESQKAILVCEENIRNAMYVPMSSAETLLQMINEEQE